MKLYYAVIDTNVIVSSFLKHDSIPGLIADMALNGSIVPLLHEEIIKEYKEVLSNNKFNFDQSIIDAFLNDLISKGIFLDKTETNEVFHDTSDMVFYEITLTGRGYVDSYLITGNKKHFPNKTFVVTPREMIDIITRNI